MVGASSSSRDGCSGFMYVSAPVCFGLCIAMLPLSASFGFVEGVFFGVDGCDYTALFVDVCVFCGMVHGGEGSDSCVVVFIYRAFFGDVGLGCG